MYLLSRNRRLWVKSGLGNKKIIEIVMSSLGDIWYGRKLLETNLKHMETCWKDMENILEIIAKTNVPPVM